MSHAHAQQVIRLYRELFRYAKLLPKPKCDEAFLEARTAFHKNKNESDTKQIEEMVKAANSRLSFLKVITPRKRGSHDNGKYILENGQWVREKSDKPEKSDVLQSDSMGSLVKRNNDLIARQRRAGL